jgi:hypothetical protein
MCRPSIAQRRPEQVASLRRLEHLRETLGHSDGQEAGRRRNRTAVGRTWVRTTLPAVVATASYNANHQQLTFGGGRGTTVPD